MSKVFLMPRDRQDAVRGADGNQRFAVAGADVSAAPPVGLFMKRKKSLLGSTTITSPGLNVFLYASRL